jgi:hypothetical protein
MIIGKRTNHQRELEAKMKSFRLEVTKVEDGKYKCSVDGQQLSAEGSSEADAVRNLKQKAEAMFKSGELSGVVQQRMV